MNGFLNILKPPGMSSAAVVAAVRRLTGEKRVGHAGTLDPEAAGILPVMIGKAARLFDFLADKEKEYIAVVAFGCATDTQDVTGAVIETGTAYPEDNRIRDAALALTGDISQRPGAYCALKKDGIPMYERARRGETVEVPERIVHVEEIRILGYESAHGCRILVRCGRGTYIRSICEEMGRLTGCPAHMRFLLRSATGPFTLDTAVTLEEAAMLAENGSLGRFLLKPDMPLSHLKRLDARKRARKAVETGAPLKCEEVTGELPPDGEPARLYLDGEFWGIVEYDGKMLKFRAQIAPEPTNDEIAKDEEKS